jgi:CTP synthase
VKKDRETILAWKDDPSFSFRLGTLDYSKPAILERHRHRYEVNEVYIDRLQSHGFTISGWHMRRDGRYLVEFLEIPEHPYFITTQAHPEFRSRLEDPAPLFLGFIEAAEKNENAS